MKLPILAAAALALCRFQVSNAVRLRGGETIINPTGLTQVGTGAPIVDVNIDPTQFEPISQVGSTGEFGSNILKSMESIGENQAQTLEEIKEAMNSGDLTTSELLSLQLKMQQLTQQQELASKVADKTSQGVQTLFKNQ